MGWKYSCYYKLTYYPHGKVWQYEQLIAHDSLIVFALHIIPVLFRYKIVDIRIRRGFER